MSPPHLPNPTRSFSTPDYVPPVSCMCRRDKDAKRQMCEKNVILRLLAVLVIAHQMPACYTLAAHVCAHTFIQSTTSPSLYAFRLHFSFKWEHIFNVCCFSDCGSGLGLQSFWIVWNSISTLFNCAPLATERVQVVMQSEVVHLSYCSNKTKKKSTYCSLCIRIEHDIRVLKNNATELVGKSP